MKKIFLLLLLLLLINNNLISQNKDWVQVPFLESKVSKLEGKIRYIVDSKMTNAERNSVVVKTEEYIVQNLKLINESEFDEPIEIVLDREIDYFGGKIWGMAMPKSDNTSRNMINSRYGPKRNTLKNELMLLIAMRKWGKPKDYNLEWLVKGLPVYANPEAFDYDGHNFEERYAYFLQNNELLTTNSLLNFNVEETMPSNKIAYCQVAFLVDYLITHHGIEKLKTLWQQGMSSFEKIYGEPFDKLLTRIKEELNYKYSKPIDFNWNAFNTDCFANQYDEWLPLDPFLYKPEKFKGMVSKVVGNIRYTTDSTRSISERDYIIKKTQEDIANNLAFIDEPRFDKFVHVIIETDTLGMIKHLGMKLGGIAFTSTGMNKELFKEHSVFCIYEGGYFPLKHELMHIITFLHWGDPFNNTYWLIEGIASIADPDMFNCDGYTYEERYAAYMQNDKLFNIDKLMNYTFPINVEWVQTKIGYNQSAYIVEYLLREYGVKKFKTLWQSGMKDFEKIYKCTIDEIIAKIKGELEIKYPKPIAFDWDRLKQDCYTV